MFSATLPRFWTGSINSYIDRFCYSMMLHEKNVSGYMF
jgi:hypothetical protein